MAALTKGRNTPERASHSRRAFPVKAGVQLFPGAQVAVDSSGRAVPMTTALALRGIGRSPALYDNRLGADGALTAEVEAGTFVFANSAGADEITKADVGNDCYGVDDQTVAKTSASNTRSIAGKIFDVTAEGVSVRYS
ncbi:hypothetical protein [Pararhizobium sp.]|uniref:hypothetical protein n=1 Tax=Pararhizobium sp. TaxID=1977563 RepID=UPI003D0D534A